MFNLISLVWIWNSSHMLLKVVWTSPGVPFGKSSRLVFTGGGFLWECSETAAAASSFSFFFAACLLNSFRSICCMSACVCVCVSLGWGQIQKLLLSTQRVYVCVCVCVCIVCVCVCGGGLYRSGYLYQFQQKKQKNFKATQILCRHTSTSANTVFGNSISFFWLFFIRKTLSELLWGVVGRKNFKHPPQVRVNWNWNAIVLRMNSCCFLKPSKDIPFSIVFRKSLRNSRIASATKF